MPEQIKLQGALGFIGHDLYPSAFYRLDCSERHGIAGHQLLSRSQFQRNVQHRAHIAQTLGGQRPSVTQIAGPGLFIEKALQYPRRQIAQLDISNGRNNMLYAVIAIMFIAGGFGNRFDIGVQPIEQPGFQGCLFGKIKNVLIFLCCRLHRCALLYIGKHTAQAKPRFFVHSSLARCSAGCYTEIGTVQPSCCAGGRITCAGKEQVPASLCCRAVF